MAEQLTQQNVVDIKPDLYLRHLAGLDKATRGKDTQVAGMRKVRKEMKGDGVDLDAFNLLMKLKKFEPEERIRILRVATVYAGWEGVELPPWRVGDNEQPQGMFDVEPPSEEARKAHHDNKVAMDAWNSRKAGGPLENNPHPVGSEDHQTWDAGWRRADREFKGVVPVAAKKAAEEAPPGDDDDGGGRTAAPRRGRPAGSKNKAKTPTAAEALGTARDRLN